MTLGLMRIKYRQGAGTVNWDIRCDVPVLADRIGAIKRADLSRMQGARDGLLANCIASGGVHPCPIIEAPMGEAR